MEHPTIVDHPDPPYGLLRLYASMYRTPGHEWLTEIDVLAVVRRAGEERTVVVQNDMLDEFSEAAALAYLEQHVATHDEDDILGWGFEK